MKKSKQTPRSRSERWNVSAAGSKPPPGTWYISGLNGVRECLVSPHVGIRQVWAERARVTPELWKLLAPHGKRLVELTGKDTPHGPATQGVAALITPPQWPDMHEILDRVQEHGREPLILALDQVEDPMNLGQILRTCEGVGVDGVLFLKHRSATLNQTAAQVSQGAFAWLPTLEVTNLRHTLEQLKARGCWVVGCDAGSGSMYWDQCDLASGLVLVMGAEGRGLRKLTRETCDILARLPMRGHVDSLNVGAACAAMLYEVMRQRGPSGYDTPQR